MATGGTSQRPSTKVWTKETVPADLWLPDTVQRMSTCEVEVDGVFSEILNRLQIGGEAGHISVGIRCSFHMALCVSLYLLVVFA